MQLADISENTSTYTAVNTSLVYPMSALVCDRWQSILREKMIGPFAHRDKSAVTYPDITDRSPVQTCPTTIN